jgi:hypothetical protein
MSTTANRDSRRIGPSAAIAGVVIAYTGFSGLAMAINVPANSILILWMIFLGIHGWRRSSF